MAERLLSIGAFAFPELGEPPDESIACWLWNGKLYHPSGRRIQGGPNKLRKVNPTRLRAKSNSRGRVTRVWHSDAPTKFSNQD